MFSLPIEVQHDVLKCLDFEQLFSVKQTNFYLRSLINKYEGGLARKDLHSLSIINENERTGFLEYIELKSGFFEFTLDDQIKEKWKTAIDKSIPLLLHESESVKNLIVSSTERKNYFLKLPTIPKNIEEMVILRCWLEQLFNCAFSYAYFDKIVFNPEMINILFDNDKTITLQFQVHYAYVWPSNTTFENILNFSVNYISIFESLSIKLDRIDITEQHINILFNILANEGNKLPKIYLRGFTLTELYDLIIEYITTSARNFPKMLPVFHLNYYISSTYKLSERAKKVEIEQLNGVKYTKYQIVNIHNPKVRFSFCNEEQYGSIDIKIRKMVE
uniref:F-box domain-containing protein n=1 Tax=Meloidogyne incognita TaxID=6306 RepID=A0A914LXM9_MELIC